MQESTTREKILKSIRKALIHQSDAPGSYSESEKRIYKSTDEDLAVQFAKQLTINGGTFVYCQDLLEFAEQFILACNEFNLSKIFSPEPDLDRFLQTLELPVSTEQEHNVLLSTCHALIARHGSVCISSNQTFGSQIYTHASVHAILAGANQLNESIKDAIKTVRNKNDNKLPQALHIISGPSKTSDIELEPIQGVYTTKQLIVFLIDKEPDVHQFLKDIENA